MRRTGLGASSTIVHKNKAHSGIAPGYLSSWIRNAAKPETVDQEYIGWLQVECPSTHDNNTLRHRNSVRAL